MENRKLTVLVIDDEENIRHMLSMILKKEGYEVETAEHGLVGLNKLERREYDLVICDVRMPKMSGLELLDALAERGIPATVIVMSAFGSRETAIEAMKRGAYDYIDKPFKKDEVLLTFAKAGEVLRLRQENVQLRETFVLPAEGFEGMIGASESIQSVFQTVSKVAEYDSTILVVGESGTGKELVARAIHNRSTRSEGPWVPINCGAIPTNLLESELFGHVKGAFTDAQNDKRGLFEEANEGTVFLDEIGELPYNVQVKLLRVLQEGEIRPVGSNKDIKIDVRIIAATLKDLEEEVKANRFREDLYYRLNVIQVKLPPLRQRRDDIVPLIDHFIGVQNVRLKTDVKGVAPAALKLMLEYAWPGNVRELQNCIERGVVLTPSDMIVESVLPDRIRDANDELKLLFQAEGLSIKKMSAALERILIRRALEETGGNRTNAAKLLEISHRTLLYKIKDYGLEKAGQ